ncbi:MAG: hypothetical protein KDK40_01735, partial [Chlamydiia bacterium]|nr:hypothetical protein [Chlamydiia bacterium]
MSAGRPNSILTDRVRGLLKVFFVLFVLIGLKTWNLAVVKRDTLAERAQRPMKKTNVLHASRGTIEDREQAPLATNTIQYEAAVRYSQIREIPVWRWEIDEHGHKIKQPNRRQYIRSLAVCLASELQLDPDRIEDLIHSKAALYDQMPYTIKRDLSEGEYYRLRAMMGDWPGLEVYSKARRFYPQGKVACDVVGYIGRIDREEYERLARERHEILNLLAQIEHLETPEVDSLKERLEHLEQLCYTMNDTIGKSGVESSFEETLRGCVGKKFSYADARGNRLFDLPGSWEPIPGERVPLSLSLELQKFCEELLVRDEPLRRTRIHKQTSSGAQHVNASEVKEPWIKGGAIVAYDPQNGQVVALASFPRFDPNDFIPSGDSQKD